MVGLPTAATDYVDFAGTRAVVSRRWDRYVASDGSVVRLHQEDLCQALAVYPAQKYQADGGPSPGDVITLLRSLRLDDVVWLFARAWGSIFSSAGLMPMPRTTRFFILMTHHPCSRPSMTLRRSTRTRQAGVNADSP